MAMVGGTHREYKKERVFKLAKRYIDTKIFDKSWFRRLSAEVKAVWFYLITRCDHAGILDFDYDSFNFHLSVTHSEKDYLKLFKQFENRVLLFENNTKVWVKTFIDYQYGGLETLNPNVRPQKAVIDRLINQGLLDPETMVYKAIDNDTDKAKKARGEAIIVAYKPKLKERFNDSVDVDEEVEKMIDWIKQSGKSYKDYEAFARNWCRNSKGTFKNKKGSGKYTLADFKKETGGFNIGYCYECGEYQFYNDYEVFQDSRCCKKRILPKRREVENGKQSANNNK